MNGDFSIFLISISENSPVFQKVLDRRSSFTIPFAPLT